MATQAQQENRKAKRVEVALPSRVRHSGTAVAPVHIRNLSFYGFRADGALPLKHGDYVSVDLPNLGLVRARIAWCKEDRFGAVFPTAIDVRKCVEKPRSG
jgi:hypothetical protein